MRTRTMAPPVGAFAADAVPPWAAARAATIANPRPLPPTDEDLLQLEATISHYKILIANLGKLRVAIDGALGRLKSP